MNCVLLYTHTVFKLSGNGKKRRNIRIETLNKHHTEAEMYEHRSIISRRLDTLNHGMNKASILKEGNSLIAHNCIYTAFKLSGTRKKTEITSKSLYKNPSTILEPQITQIKTK